MIKYVRTEYETGQEAVKSITGKYLVENITAEGDKSVASLVEDKTVPNDMNADWVKEHIEQHGKAPELF